MAEAEGVNEAPLTRYHLVVFQDEHDDIDRTLVRAIQASLDEQITTPPEQTAIDLWIESLGGDAHAAYKLIIDLRSRCAQLRSIVPDYAKSAATLIVLGTDEIFMAPAAELGPLDVQIEHPDREGLIVSGLEVAGAIDFISRSAITLVLTGGASLVKYTGLPRAVVLQESLRFSARLFAPVVERLDLHLISQASKQLQVTERYAMTMLKKRNLPQEKQLDVAASQKMLKRLVSEYPVHEFVITRNEARGLDLPISDLKTHDRWPLIKSLYDQPREKGKTQLYLIPDSDLEAIDKSATGHQENSDEAGTQEHVAPEVVPDGNGASPSVAASGTIKKLTRPKATGRAGANA